MSVIALNEWFIATDGRCTSDGTILDDDYVKMCCFGPEKDIFLFYVGDPGFLEQFKKSYLTDEPFPLHENQEIDIDCIALENGKAFHCYIDPEFGFIYKTRISVTDPFAIGSGMDHAYTAMDMGATAAMAVKMATMRDPFCGGNIRRWEFGFHHSSNKPYLKDLLIYKSKYHLIKTQVKE